MIASPVQTRGTILVVEDDAFLRRLLVEKLSKEGFTIIEAANGKEALLSVSETLPLLVVLDLVMPEVDGFQVLEELRKNERTKNIPVIVLSNLGEQEYIERAKNFGADEYLIKAHYILDEIAAKIMEVIKKKYL